MTTKEAEQYAKKRLGLGDDWCAYAWSACIDRNGAEDAFDAVDKVMETATRFKEGKR